jgi:hypothetical protein
LTEIVRISSRVSETVMVVAFCVGAALVGLCLCALAYPANGPRSRTSPHSW